jgi:UDP-N-acetylmuramoyl-tripeptide--D-alanyl-D-alanine ligase
VPGRLCLKKIDGISFLDDSYNSNPGSFRAALETLKSFKTPGKKGVVCGDMLELGAQSEAFHRQLGALAAELLFDFVVACGGQSKFLVEEALKAGYHQSKITHVKDSAEAGKICQKLVSPGDLVLVKGSRGMHMEKIFECFISCSTP